MTRLSLWLFKVSAALMPVAQSEWLRAMRAELNAIPSGSAQLRFAAGCLRTAFDAFSRTRAGLSLIGRGLVCAALAALCTYAALMLGQLSTPEVAPLLAMLITIYAISGGLCAFSLRGMRVYCGMAAAAFFVLATTLHLSGFVSSALGNAYLCALSLEATCILFGLFLAACFLERLHIEEA